MGFAAVLDAVEFASGIVFAVVVGDFGKHAGVGVAAIPAVNALAIQVQAAGFNVASPAGNVSPPMLVSQAGSVYVSAVAAYQALDLGGVEIPLFVLQIVVVSYTFAVVAKQG